jgi:hypothetical protein
LELDARAKIEGSIVAQKKACSARTNDEKESSHFGCLLFSITARNWAITWIAEVEISPDCSNTEVKINAKLVFIAVERQCARDPDGFFLLLFPAQAYGKNGKRYNFSEIFKCRTSESSDLSAY